MNESQLKIRQVSRLCNRLLALGDTIAFMVFFKAVDHNCREMSMPYARLAELRPGGSEMKFFYDIFLRLVDRILSSLSICTGIHPE